MYNCFRCFTFVFALNSLSCFSKERCFPISSPEKPKAKSGSLYFWKGRVMRPGNSDAEVADVYYQRVVVAKAVTQKQSLDWTPHQPPPCVLKSRHDSLNNVWTPHQRVDTEFAKNIWKLNIWEWRAKRISFGNSLSAPWRCGLARLLGAPR